MGQKFATSRYHVLDQCFSNTGKKYSISDLVEMINNKLSEEDLSIQKRQVYDDIKYMESDAGYGVELVKEKIGRKVYYRYKDPSFSIKNQPLNESEKLQFKEAINSLQRFKGLPQFEWVKYVYICIDGYNEIWTYRIEQGCWESYRNVEYNYSCN